MFRFEISIFFSLFDLLKIRSQPTIYKKFFNYE